MIDSQQKILDLEGRIDMLNASLNDFQHLSNIGSWNWNVETNQVTWSDNMFRLLGLDKNELEPSYELALHHVHESDKENYEEVLRIALKNKTFYYLENRITKKDNSVISVISRGNCVFDSKGDLTQMYGTVQDVSIEKHLEKALQEKVKAEEADRVRSMFLSIISHDLKHPLLILKNYSKVLVESIQSGEFEKVKEYGTIINKTSKQSFNIIDNLLEWIRVNSSNLKYIPEKINFKQFIDEIIQPFSIISNKKNIAIHVIEQSNLEVFADKNVLSIVFTHLIENALKFSNKNGQITVSVSSIKNVMEFSIADNGVGIEAEFQETMFTSDFMFSTLGTDGEPGTGIGLKLCKTLIEKYNGVLRIDSEIGKGTTCVFSIPNP
jgi:PAS domain S-box-containing protein